MRILSSLIKNNDSLKEKTVLITGASSGIGASIAIELAKQKSILILTGRNQQRLEDVKEQCQHYSSSVYTYQMDLLDINQVDQVLDELLSHHKIDVFMNNAGIGLTEYFIKNTYQSIEQLFQVNVLSMMYLSQKVAIHMIDNGGGHIFHTASVAGKVPTPKTAVYSASKAAIIAFSNAIRMELASYHIKVTTINPGPVDTRFFDNIKSGQDYLQKVKPFVLSSETVAKKIVATIGSSRRELTVPISMKVGSLLYQLAPTMADKIVTALFKK